MKLLSISLIIIVLWSCSRKPILTENIIISDTIAAVTYSDTAYVQDFAAPVYLRDQTFAANIKTVLLHVEGVELSNPVISISGNNKLLFSFDDLKGDIKDYMYTVIHCTYDWQPSGLQPGEYIDGFSENKINDYNFSFNTTEKYMHYSLLLPNDNVKFKKSGNYILTVYVNGSPDKPVITKRFMVYDEKAVIDYSIRQPGVFKYRNSHQQIEFKVTYSGVTVKNPFEEIKVNLLQNNRWDNARMNIKPAFVSQSEMNFNDPNDNVLPGGNEFRQIDIRSLRYKSQYIFSIAKDTAYHVKLLADEVRSYKQYFFNRDINGKYFIEVYEGGQKELEGDYTYVNFFLPMSAPVTNGNIYIFGALSDWDIQDELKMKYNYEKKAYEGRAYLKQGFYNYYYIFAEDGNPVFDESLIEGNDFETENEYTVYVYYRAFGNRYDELIGVKNFSTLIK